MNAAQAVTQSLMNGDPRGGAAGLLDAAEDHELRNLRPLANICIEGVIVHTSPESRVIVNNVSVFEKGKTVGGFGGVGGGVSVTRLPSGRPPFIVNTNGDPSML
jgi:hypothetical protein